MAKLYVHGHPVIDYVRKRTGREVGPTRADNEYEERVYRLMSDGKLLTQFASGWLHKNFDGSTGLMKTRSGWKIAKVKPEIVANPDRLIELGFKKKVIGPVEEDEMERGRR